jgi:hypothetical protein
MALVLKDRVRETSFTAGTGTITLSGAVAGFQDFSVIGDGNTTYYVIADSITGEWEVGIGTYTSSGTTLSRDTILESSDGGTAVDFAGNPKDVFCTYPAERSVYVDGSNIVPGATATLPLASLGGLGTGVATFLATPSSANLAAAVTDETGSGLLVFATSPSLTTPNIGAATGTSLAVTTVDTTNLEVTNIKALDGTAAATIADSTGVVTVSTQLNVDNIRLDGNTISTTNTNGNLTTTANGTGYYIYSGTQAVLVPKGNNTTERPGTPVTGMLRYNTTSDEFEGYSGSSPAWKSVGGAAITNDTTTASDLYPAYLNATTGTAATLFTSNAQYLFKPSTGELKVKAPVAQNGILVNATTMTSNYTIATGTNGLSVGPFTIDSGVTLTIDSGQRHLIL